MSNSTPSRPVTPQQAATELLRRRKGRTSLEGFVGYTFADYRWSWHNRLICRKLDDLLSGRTRRLMIFAPPRHGKSELASVRLPAYALGRNPDTTIIAASHNSDFASDFNLQVQGVIDSPEYQRLFPGTRLKGASAKGPGRDYKRTDSLFEVVGAKGRYQSAGLETGITGKGMKLGIIDDPIKDAKTAYSPAAREAVWNWYKTTFRTRKAPDASILVMMTRWHLDDLAGRLLRLAEDELADQWDVLWLPALGEDGKYRNPDDHRAEGEALWPDQFPRGELLNDRATMGSLQFGAMYQQLPLPADGAKFKEEWFGGFVEEGTGYRVLRDGRFVPRGATWRLTVIDPAATDGKSSDWTAIGTYAISTWGDVFVLNMVRERLPLERIIPRLKLVAGLYHPLYVAVEATGFQKAVAREARQLMPNVEIRGVDPQGKGKLVRAFPAIARAERGKIHFPAPLPEWARVFIEEMVNFTGNNDPHDDQVDTLAYAVQLAGDGGDDALPFVAGKPRAQ